MKNILIFLLILSAFFGCQKQNDQDKKPDNAKFTKTIPGGCAVDTVNHKDIGIDTVYYTLDNGDLNVFVGFNDECCLHFTTDSQIRNDTIFMNVIYIPGPVCGCLCYYTYNFFYTGIDHSYYYVVNVADWLIFKGKIEP